jgi:Mce-associated membrane protein
VPVTTDLTKPAAKRRLPVRSWLAALNPQGPTARGVLASVLVLLMVALAALIGWQAWQLSANATTAARQTAAVTAARDVAQNLLSYNYTTIDADQKHVVDRITGDFKDQYTSGQAQIKSQVTQLKGSSSATILAAGLVSADKDSATVLISADVTAKSTQDTKGTVRHLRMQEQMSFQGGRWLLANLNFI